MPARSNGFDKDPERARAAARKSKRRPFDKIMRDWLESNASKEGKMFDAIRKKLNLPPDASVNDLIKIAVALNAIKKGDGNAADKLWSRAYGKAPETVDVEVDVYHHGMEKLTDEELARIAGYQEKPNEPKSRSKSRNSKKNPGKKKS